MSPLQEVLRGCLTHVPGDRPSAAELQGMEFFTMSEAELAGWDPLPMTKAEREELRGRRRLREEEKISRQHKISGM